MLETITTPLEAQSRLDLFRRRNWSYDEIADWYGVELWSPSDPFLAQFIAWERRSKRVIPDPGGINRTQFELFLQSRQLTTERSAAVQLAMTEESFRLTLEAARQQGFLSATEADGEFPRIYRTDLISGLYKRFPALQHITFSSHSSFVKRLHKQIKDDLGVEVTPLLCVTSKALGEDPVAYAHDQDIITKEPMSIGYQVWLETDKPIQIRPDSCSWVTYIRFELVLKPIAFSKRDLEIETHRNAIRRFLGI